MNKFLLIGSAPYIKDWYAEFGKTVLNRGYKLCAINNAWSIDPDNVWWWLHSTDFIDLGKVQPTHKVRMELESRAKNPAGENNYKYEFRGSGTMLLNCLCDLLNYSLNTGERCTVAVAGCDCVYSKKETHFYGSSTKDPLRFGAQWLVKELERIEGFYEEEGCKLYNVGLRDTLLPFRGQLPTEI